MLKNFCFAVVAVALFTVSANAKDNMLSGKIDLGSIRDADNTVVEPKLAVDVNSLVNKAGDKNDQAVEVCCRSWGCYNSCCYRPSYNCCYSSCYSSYYYPSYSCYSSCYYPSYSCCYTPCYTYSYCPTYTYAYSYPTYSSCCYQPSYSCCSLSNWGCY